MSDANDFGSRVDEQDGLFWQPEPDGPFVHSTVTPSADERVVAAMIWRHKGRADPISIAKLSAATGHNDREVKGIVEQLVVTHRMKIGGRRGEPSGYFAVVDSEDLEMAQKPYREQVLAMWRRLRVLMEPRTLLELRGQLVIDKGDEPK